MIEPNQHIMWPDLRVPTATNGVPQSSGISRGMHEKLSSDSITDDAQKLYIPDVSSVPDKSHCRVGSGSDKMRGRFVNRLVVLE